MTWFAAGAAVVGVATTAISANSAKGTAIKDANTASKAEGDAIAKQQLNTTVRNSYATAFAQMQFALKKQQAAQSGADIRALTLGAASDAATGIAGTGSIGASVGAVTADIAQKSQQALDQSAANFETDLTNYNNSLQMMELNTREAAPNVRPLEYHGPSGGEILGLSVAQGMASFASSYAQRKIQLGMNSPKGKP